MAKKKHNLIITHTFADGRMMSDEEFMSKPFVVEYEKNKEIYEEAQRISDPLYREKERERRRRENAEARRLTLEKELGELKKEISLL